MNRYDFSSISTCLKNHISESNQMSQPDFLYELFEDFMDDPANQDFSMDNGLVCRWMTGQAKISPKISAYYSKPSNQKKLAHLCGCNTIPSGAIDPHSYVPFSGHQLILKKLRRDIIIKPALLCDRAV